MAEIDVPKEIGGRLPNPIDHFLGVFARIPEQKYTSSRFPPKILEGEMLVNETRNEPCYYATAHRDPGQGTIFTVESRGRGNIRISKKGLWPRDDVAGGELKWEPYSLQRGNKPRVVTPLDGFYFAENPEGEQKYRWWASLPYVDEIFRREATILPGNPHIPQVDENSSLIPTNPYKITEYLQALMGKEVGKAGMDEITVATFPYLVNLDDPDRNLDIQKIQAYSLGNRFPNTRATFLRYFPVAVPGKMMVYGFKGSSPSDFVSWDVIPIDADPVEDYMGIHKRKQ